MARISPLPAAEWPPELVAFLGGFSAAEAGAKERDDAPSAINMLGTLARHPSLAGAFLTFNDHILNRTTLPARVRELLVLRVASRRQSDYEWSRHVWLAHGAGLQDEDIARVIAGPDAPGWTPVESSLLRAVDELLADGAVGSETWDVLAAAFDDQQLLDVVFTVGAYETLAFALRSFAIEPDPDTATDAAPAP